MDARNKLWNRLIHISQQVNSPWLVGGDFNCIISTFEKSGGRTPNRMLVNDAWFNHFLLTFVTHLSLAGSDHRPILISITSTDNYSSPLPFRYLNMWAAHPSYSNYIVDLWKGVSHPDPLVQLSLLQIKIAKALRGWSWNTFGNVNATVQKAEDEVKALENGGQLGIEEEKKLLIAQNNLLSVIDYQEKFLKQKATMNIFTDGDRNTRFFHAYIKYKRKCNTIQDIQNANGQWLHNNNDITNDVISTLRHEKAHFMAELNYTAGLKLTDIPTEKEIWNAINSIDNSKSTSPDGFTAEFYKKS
ncbi:uncharacterized protein LOC110036703 [Phalaenopsis equestris]|uniref:uncharacterized protein LOC110036703 n=1 Tax=Phalaenopsis equestris TaxID=78828 RepID=UPI0009E29B45|nr:uncharacterized protein LOC110036703 [Phalaenopsis equestris]